MNSSIFDGIEQDEVLCSQVDPASFYAAFEKVKDKRKAKGKRYPLALILTLLVLGKLAGETTLSGIAGWIKERKEILKKQLFWPKGFPVVSTYSKVLTLCDAKEIMEVFSQVILKAQAMEECSDEPSRLVAQKHGEEKLIHTAMDGKTMRGTCGHVDEEQPPVHLLSLYECETGIMIAQEVVESKENEITAAKAVLDPLFVKGRIITADAMHTQTKWCAGVHAYGGYYILLAKDNQPTLVRDLRDFFEAKELDQGEWEYHKKVQKGHGRHEVREIWASTQMNLWFEKRWAGCAQCFCIKRTIRGGKKGREQIVYGFTNLPREKAHAGRLLELNQKHWSIENRLHYRRDVTLGEDHCQVRVKNAPPVLAALNSGILSLMDYLSVSNVAAQMRRYCAQPQEALQLLFGKLAR